MKVMVAIVNHGTKNMQYLHKLLSAYHSMSRDIHIVIISNIPKDLGPDIEVIIHVPKSNPWALPYPHKKLFADRVNDYDLFIYSEDDILITEKNINAFLEVTKILPDNEIAGFTRSEIDKKGRKYYTDIHGAFLWDPGSVKSIGNYTFAYLTNEHSGCYILTQSQLLKLIESGKYLLNPREGRYDMLCTAATDPYTQGCFKKMICISHLEYFTLPHLSNIYIGEMGVETSEVEIQLEALKQIEQGARPASQLFNPRTKLTHPLWDKRYYESCRHEILSMISPEVQSVLSVGCGSGEIEVKLIKKGIRVTAIPMDSIIGVCVEAKGVEVLSPDFEKGIKELGGQQFDCILFVDILHHLLDPAKILSAFTNKLSRGGYVIVSGRNFNHTSVWGKKYSKNPSFREFRSIGNYDKSGLHRTTLRKIKSWMLQSGIKPIQIKGDELHYTTSRKEKDWPLQGGLKQITAIKKTAEKYQGVAKVLSELINSFFSSTIIVLGKKVSKEQIENHYFI